jgi:hypothetical protein
VTAARASLGLVIAIALALLAAGCKQKATAGAAPSLTVRGTDLVLTTGDGRTLRSADLIGATLTIGAVNVRLEAVDRDPGSRAEVLRHRFAVLGRDGARGELCEADPDGDRWAIPVLDDQGQVQLMCSSGAIVKCVRWGYPPAMRALHQACVRMVRADYGGDDATATRDGTRIMFCDRSGVHACPDDGRILEAAWSPTGATCVAHPRIPELMTLDRLAERYPPLRGHLGGDECTMAAATREPRALLFSFFP